MEYYNIDSSSTFLVSQKALISYKNKILILGKRNGNLVTWELPGGLLEMNENLMEGLSREVNEETVKHAVNLVKDAETGLKISENHLFTIWDHYIEGFRFKDGRILNCRVIEIAYKCNTLTNQVTLSSEHDNYNWVDLCELSQYTFHENSRFAIDRLIENHT